MTRKVGRRITGLDVGRVIGALRKGPRPLSMVVGRTGLTRGQARAVLIHLADQGIVTSEYVDGERIWALASETAE